MYASWTLVRLRNLDHLLNFYEYQSCNHSSVGIKIVREYQYMIHHFHTKNHCSKTLQIVQSIIFIVVVYDSVQTLRIVPPLLLLRGRSSHQSHQTLLFLEDVKESPDCRVGAAHQGSEAVDSALSYVGTARKSSNHSYSVSLVPDCCWPGHLLSIHQGSLVVAHH